MAKIYGIISGKGGVGKTTSAINLGAALNSLKEDVIVVDTNLTTPNIGLHLGSGIVPVTLNDVLSEKASISDAVYEHYSGLKILPASLSLNELKQIKYEKLQNITSQLRKLSSHVILDSSAGLGKDVESVINAADEVIIVTQPEMPAITDALKVAKVAEQLNKKIAGFILTRLKNKKAEMSAENIKDMLELPLLGIIPEDKNIQKSLALKDAIIHKYPKSKASKAYQNIAKKLIGKKDSPLYSRILEKLGL